MFSPSFIIIPKSVYQDKKLQPLDLKVWGIIYWYLNLKDGKCFASNLSIARQCGCLERSAKRSVKRLEERGHIKRYFKDKSKRNRIRIEITSALMGQMVTREGPSDDSIEGASGHHIKNNIEKNREVATKVATPPKKTRKDSDPMTLDEFVKLCRKDKNRHINLIAEYADEKKVGFKTYGQWRLFIVRNVRPARDLSHFDDDQISKAMKRIDQAKNGDRYLTKWTLETVLKYLED